LIPKWDRISAKWDGRKAYTTLILDGPRVGPSLLAGKEGSHMMHRILEAAVFVAMVLAPFAMIKLSELRESKKSR
jgi:hypothetical protein